MLTYLLILFVIALALAPLSHFVPSKRQRKIARMREYAAVHGLFVEYRQTPGGGAARAGQRQGQVIYYGKRLPPARGAQLAPASWLRDEQGWRSVGKRRALSPILDTLDPEIQAASVDSSSCGVYWTESGAEDDVERIRQVLEQWSEDLMHR